MCVCMHVCMYVCMYVMLYCIRIALPCHCIVLQMWLSEFYLDVWIGSESSRSPEVIDSPAQADACDPDFISLPLGALRVALRPDAISHRRLYLMEILLMDKILHYPL